MEYLKDRPDCILDFRWTKLIKCEQPARPRDATPDWDFPGHVFPFMLGRKWGDDSKCSTDADNTRPAERLTPVTISGKKAKNSDQSHLVLSYASVVIDRESDTREFHRILFSKDQWDELAHSVGANEKVILECCTIGFDPKDEEAVIDTIEHYDFGDGCGFETGTYKRYIPGVVTNVVSVSIARDLQMPVERSENESQRQSPYARHSPVPTYDDLYDECYPLPPTEEDSEEYDDYEPKLSDYYDDLEELELNTRGDGYD